MAVTFEGWPVATASSERLRERQWDRHRHRSKKPFHPLEDYLLEDIEAEEKGTSTDTGVRDFLHLFTTLISLCTYGAMI